MIKSVVRTYQWTPDKIASLNISGEDDFNSLEFWYNDAKEVSESLKAK